MKVISLSALCPQSGKDTLAEFIKTMDSNLNVQVIAFGDALRLEIVQLFHKGRCSVPTFDTKEIARMLLTSSKDVPHEAFAINKLTTSASSRCVCTYDDTYRSMLAEHFKYNPEELTKPRSLRFHLQRYGNDFTKELKGDTTKWIDVVRTKLETFKEMETDLVIVTDTRAPEEYDFLIKEYNATTILIERQGFPVTKEELERVPHKIEEYTRSMDFDWTISNVYGDKEHMQSDFYHIYYNYIAK